jgi:hypothetical protein
LGERRSSTSDLRSGVAESAAEAAADQVVVAAVAVVAKVEGVEEEVVDEEEDEEDDDSEMRFHQRKLSGGAGDGESTRAEGDGCDVGRYE